MKVFPLLLTLLLSFAPAAHAQIYADVTVSHDETELGTFRVQLHHTLTPRTVANFIGLATGERNWIDPQTGALQIGKPYYDGLNFHRLDHNFVLQGGDPLGTGGGGPGYIFQDEFHSSLVHNEYVLSMANSGANTNGSQFFITLSSPTFLDNKHSVFGEVINDATYPNSRNLIDGFKNSTNFPTTNESPDSPITIDSIIISGPDYAGFDINASSLRLPPVSEISIQLIHDSETSDFSLSWVTERKHDYPVYYSTELENWFNAGKVLSMDDNAQYTVGINAIATETTGFYRTAKIDYSDMPDAPQNPLANGASLAFTLDDGTLNLNFDGAGSGTWTFVYNDGITEDESGTITSSSLTNNSSFPVIPTTGSYINIQTYATYLSVRQITVFLDGPAGPNGITAVQPVLSFHQTTSGWFDGPVNSSTAVTFRGEFVYSAPAP